MPTTSDDNLEDPCRHTPCASWLVALERTCRPLSSINPSQQPIRSADIYHNKQTTNLFFNDYIWDRGTDRVHDTCKMHRSASSRRADDNSHRSERGDGDFDRRWSSTDGGECLGHCGPNGPFTLLRCKMFVAAQSGALVRPYTRCRTERTHEINFFTRSHIAALPLAASAARLLMTGTLTAIAQIKWEQAAGLCELACSPCPPESPNVLSTARAQLLRCHAMSQLSQPTCQPVDSLAQKLSTGRRPKTTSALATSAAVSRYGGLSAVWGPGRALGEWVVVVWGDCAVLSVIPLSCSVCTHV